MLVVPISTFWALGPETYILLLVGLELFLLAIIIFLLRSAWFSVCHLVLLRLRQLFGQRPCELQMRMIILESFQHLDRLNHKLLLLLLLLRCLKVCSYLIFPLHTCPEPPSLFLCRQVSLPALLLSSPLVYLSLPLRLFLYLSRLSQLLLDLLVSFNLTHLSF